MAFGNFFGDAIKVLPQHDVLGQLAEDYHGPFGLVLHSLITLPFWLAVAGVSLAWFLYMKRPDVPALIQNKLKALHRILDNKYYADRFNEIVFAGGSRLLGKLLWQNGDVRVIDGIIINGSAKSVGWISTIVRRIQTGYLYNYAFAMIFGLLFLLAFFVIRYV